MYILLIICNLQPIETIKKTILSQLNKSPQ